MPAQQGHAPAKFGKYLLLDRIAAGGMAELFLAKQTGLKGFEKVVAIKRILPMLTQDPEFVTMFVNEAKLAALLSHQNIAQIFDFGTTEGFYYIAMEYVMGKDLRAVVQKSQQRGLQLSVGHALLIASRMCSGLGYAHRKKDLHGRDLCLVHRDISPQNVLLSYEGEIKLVDFGIAKATTQTNETRTGTLKGKLSYMSPEQATGQHLDCRSDIFSLGIVLHELLTSRRLFTGNNEFAILEQVRQAQITPPSQLNPDLPSEVDELVMKALTKEPADRYQQASEMELAIERLIISKGYNFSSLSFANYMHALFEQDMAEDTARLQRIATIVDAPGLQQSSVVEPLTAVPARSPVTQLAATYAPYSLKAKIPLPTRHPILKAVLLLVAVAVWGALLTALWRPDLIPPNLPERTYTTLRQQADRLVAFASQGKPSQPTTPVRQPSPPRDARPAPDRMYPTERRQPTQVTRQQRPAVDRRKERRQLYDQARDAYHAGDLATAEQQLRAALAIPPQLPHGYHLLVNILQERGNHDSAMAILNEGIYRFPNNATLHYDLGLLYISKNVSSLAVHELQTALSLEPQAPWAEDATTRLQAYGVSPPRTTMGSTVH